MSLSGRMFELLSEIYDRSETECNIEISFNYSSSGAQQNPCRDLILTYLKGPTLNRGQKIAERLASTTTNRSRLGLLFLIVGSEGLSRKIVISRFPADSGILAEQNSQGLNVEFLERIFMKSAKSYKSVFYKHTSLTAGFWKGFAVDKQINNSGGDIPNYWISEFLDSDFLVTSAAGTRRLAIALRSASKNVGNVNIKTEIAAAVTLAAGFKGQSLSIRNFATRSRLSDTAKQAVFTEVKETALDETFQMNFDEFSKHIAYRSVELDNGGMLTAGTENFDTVFHKEVINGKNNTFKFSTEGRVVGEKLRKTR